MADATDCQCPICSAGELHHCDECAVHTTKLWRNRCNCGALLASLATTGKYPEPTPLPLRVWVVGAVAVVLVAWLVVGATA